MPVLAVNVCPCWTVPVMAGNTELTGKAAITVAVGADVAGAPLPPALVAVTWTSTVSPTSVAATA